MSSRLAMFTVAAAIVAGAAAAGQSPPPAPANDDCLACHGDPDLKRTAGTPVYVDQGAFDTSKHSALECVDCHADLRAATEFPHADTLENVKCGSCHEGEAVKYQDSIHARAREKAGLTAAAPACADCHGKHDIRGPADPESRVLRATIPATCGRCHIGIKTLYDRSVHAAALKAGDSGAPTCIDCHTAHTIKRADTDAWRLSVTQECGTCHARVVDSFTRTFHGKVTQLGFARVAACADCHGAHEILPSSDAASTVSKARRVETCGKCHAGATESFVQYDPHPNPNDYSRSAALWWANRFYWLLIPACFGFFGLHSLLWFYRSRREHGKQGRR